MSQVTLLTIDNAHARATISLYGGQVLSFVPKHDGRERLFVSNKALLDGSKSIRGGIPVCWPWFGAWKGVAQSTPMPAHGYARNRRWQVVTLEEGPDHTTLRLTLPDCHGPGFTHAAKLELLLVIGATLTVELTTANMGHEPFPLSMALHTYFAVDDTRQVQLQGLQGTYSDKTRNWAMLPTPASYRFTEETDRIHLHATPQVDIVDGKHMTRVQSQGHDSVVVWNPWSDGSKAFADLAADEYLRFVCVETALTQGFTLEPGHNHTLHQTIA
ncbi:MAG TPA: D-hexose-6-phosphate mutarotase [Candidatus Acidoferrum sp.]|nr:D-hexose-6-phosphate mutarotase [Candidatus Acidoferrum sp.]